MHYTIPVYSYIAFFQVQMLEDKLMEAEHLIVETATNMAREKEEAWVREKTSLQVT